MKTHGQSRILAIAPALLALGMGGPQVMADSIGWWRMEGGVGELITTVPNTITGSGAAPDGTHTGAGASTYGAVVPNTHIYDPVSGATVANATSFSLLGTTDANTIRIDDDASLNPASFTVEFFVLSTGVTANYRPLLQRGTGQLQAGWWIGGSPDGDGGQLPSAKIANADIYDNASANPTRIDDGAWHHIALVVDNSGSEEDSGSMTLYVDYVAVRTRSLDPGDHLYDYRMDITGARWAGYIDEVRFSSGALTSDQFLQAVVPEPAAAGLLLAGGLAMARRRR